MRRLPIRLRLTAVFALMMVVLLAGIGFFVYAQLASQLDHAIDQGLRSRAGDVEALITQADTGLRESRRRLTESGESFAQILDVNGRVVDFTPHVGRRSLLSASEVRRAARGTVLVTRGSLPFSDEQSRLLATSVAAQGRRLIVVVGASLDDRNQATRTVGTLLLVGGPIALLLASAMAYWLAGSALRPVEYMRRRAAAISTTEAGTRLPVPPARDEIARLGETLNDMLERLESAFARERTFVADASHELQTPLAILKTELELAGRANRSREEVADAVSSAAEEVDRLAQLAKDLLVIARSDQGRLPVRLSRLDAEGLLANLRARYSRRAAERGRGVVIADQSEDAALMADPQRVEQALGNLIDNALRYGEGPIELFAARREGSVELHVRDDGHGFPVALLDSAFQRFSRADAARGHGGTGLGLAIVAAIAAAHGGTAHAANRPGGGADVWITLPLAAAASD